MKGGLITRVAASLSSAADSSVCLTWRICQRCNWCRTKGISCQTQISLTGCYWWCCCSRWQMKTGRRTERHTERHTDEAESEISLKTDALL